MRIKSLITAAITAAVAVPAMAHGQGYTQTRERTVTTRTVQQFPAPSYYVNPHSRTYQQDLARAKALQLQAAQQFYNLQNRTTTTITTTRTVIANPPATTRFTIIKVRPVFVPVPTHPCSTIVYNPPIYNAPPVYTHTCIPTRPARIYHYRHFYDRDDFHHCWGNRFGHERYSHERFDHERYDRDRHDWGCHEQHHDFGTGFHLEIHIGSR